jgi:hypothetical protein
MESAVLDICWQPKSCKKLLEWLLQLLLLLLVALAIQLLADSCQLEAQQPLHIV